MKTKNSLIRYLVVGGVSYLVEMAVLYAFEHASFGPVQAVAVSFWVGFVVAFTLQKFVAFQNHDKRRHTVIKQLAVYSLLVAINYMFTLLIVEMFQHIASVFVLRTAAIAIITFWNFAVYRKLFKTPTHEVPRAE